MKTPIVLTQWSHTKQKTGSPLVQVLPCCFYSLISQTNAVQIHHHMGQVVKVPLSCYLVLLSNHSIIARPGNKTAAPLWPDSYRLSGTYFNKILLKIYSFPLNKMYLKLLVAKYQRLGSCLKTLMDNSPINSEGNLSHFHACVGGIGTCLPLETWFMHSKASHFTGQFILQCSTQQTNHKG